MELLLRLVSGKLNDWGFLTFNPFLSLGSIALPPDDSVVLVRSVLSWCQTHQAKVHDLFFVEDDKGLFVKLVGVTSENNVQAFCKFNSSFVGQGILWFVGKSDGPGSGIVNEP